MEHANRERRRDSVEVSAAIASGAAAPPGLRPGSGVGWVSDSLGRTDSRPQSSARRRSRQKAGISHGNQTPTVEFGNVRPGDGRGGPRCVHPGRPNPSPLDDQPPRVHGQGDDDGLRRRGLGAGRWPATQPGGDEIEVARRPTGCVVKSTLRSWNCRNCGRSNETALALDGTLTCEYCAEVGGLEPPRPWRDRLLRRAGKLVSLMTGESGGEENRPAARGR